MGESKGVRFGFHIFQTFFFPVVKQTYVIYFTILGNGSQNYMFYNQKNKYLHQNSEK